MSALGRRREIVVVGGGAGGVELAARLGRKSRASAINVTLVDRARTHLWKPRLHEVAAGLSAAREDQIPYLALAHANNFKFRLGALSAVDDADQTVSIAAVRGVAGDEILGARRISYDSLVLAFGSEVNDFGVEGVSEYCDKLDSGEQADRFQTRLVEAILKASGQGRNAIRIGIVGAGATGVELAAQLHHTVTSLEPFGALVTAERFKITLIDRAARVLANNDPQTSAFAETTLKKLGVSVVLNASVARVTREGFVLADGELVACDLKIWASGIIGQPFAAGLVGLSLDRSRRILCDDRLRCAGVQNIFALGDCAAVSDLTDDRLLPATAQVAHQQAGYLAKALLAPSGSVRRAFRYRPMGSLVAFGAAAAGELTRKGRPAFTLHGASPRVLYVGLQLMHRVVLMGWARAISLAFADSLRRALCPPVKLH